MYIHTHTHIWSQQVVFRNICIYKYISHTITTYEKGSHEFEGVRRPIMESLKRGKGRKKYCYSNTIPKITTKEIMT